MNSIFVSYRRADAQGWAGRISSDLAAAYGGDIARFFDLTSIAPGADFRLEIDHTLANAAAVLVLIGPRWLDMRDERGQRRLDDAEDVVAAEVAQALGRAVPVIPVLLGGAAMPLAAALPERLRGLARLNAIELTDSRWNYDRDRLFHALDAASQLERQHAPDASNSSVRVGAGLILENSEVQRVTGARGAVPASGVDVLSEARITSSKIGDITGIDLGSTEQRK